MTNYERILVLQTAFLGDVILTLPLVQVLKKTFSTSKIDIMTIPRAAELLQNHPDIYNIVQYDKREKESGLRGFINKVQEIKIQNYQVAFVPHRSMRSAALVKLAKIPIRVGFHNSTGRMFYNKVVRYDNSLHEIDRNLRLLSAIGVDFKQKEYPRLYPSGNDKNVVSDILKSNNLISPFSNLIAIAPGTVWNTKRWLIERFIILAKRLIESNNSIVLIGGKEDSSLCEKISEAVNNPNIFSLSGKLTILQSAELIHKCKALVCNDSAPMHLAVAVKTPVVSIFGATIPEFGFAPNGEHDQIVEIKSLDCRPCSIHGGDKCPIKTFDCMERITVDMVYEKVSMILNLGTKDNI